VPSVCVRESGHVCSLSACVCESVSVHECVCLVCACVCLEAHALALPATFAPAQCV